MGQTEHVDVLIIGAGLSGIGAACQLRRRRPSASFAILEARESIGGTWDLFRYPGIRSDSDMFTLGYGFRPWTQASPIADGSAIREYIEETAREYRLEEAIRFGARAVRAHWCTEAARWTVQLAGGGEITCSFLYACTGYYRYDEGFSPQIEGAAEFAGRIVHPQHWPADLDHTGRRVAVIGSGATAMTLVPAMAADAEHVTMVQRSPTYVIALPNADPIAAALRRILPTRAAHAAARWKNALRTVGFYAVSRRAPRLVARLLRRAARRRLPPGYDVQTHFTPRYAPWDQRMCLVPDGDLFTAVSEGRASIVTDHIERYTQRGLLLASGAQVEADIVVTATGLNLLALGGMTLSVDGAEVDLAQTVTYKGMMLSGVPNLALIVGYTNSSWTLKADLVAEYVCRVLRHMEEHGQRICTPVAPAAGPRRPLIDLAAGYVERSAAHLPKQGSRTPWRLHQNYPRDALMLRRGRVDDEGVRFSA